MSYITGKAVKFNGDPVDYVSIFNWSDGKCIAQVLPDSFGNWSFRYAEDLSCGITYIADGCEPITHGKYQFVNTWRVEDMITTGQKGLIYDPSDLSTLFQDAAGTIPVTTSGQRIGKMLDKSGNGHHAIQPNSAKRPKYMSDGVLSWMANFDSDSNIYVPNSKTDLSFLHNGTGATVALAASAVGEDSLAQIILTESSSSRDTGFSISYANRASEPAENNSLVYTVQRGVPGQSAVKVNAENIFTNLPCVIRTSFDYKSAVNDLEIYKNEIKVVESPVDYPPPSDPSTNDLSIFSLVIRNTDIRVYGVVIVDRELTASDGAEIDHYLAVKSGVNL